MGGGDDDEVDIGFSTHSAVIRHYFPRTESGTILMSYDLKKKGENWINAFGNMRNMGSILAPIITNVEVKAKPLLVDIDFEAITQLYAAFLEEKSLLDATNITYSEDVHTILQKRKLDAFEANISKANNLNQYPGDMARTSYSHIPGAQSVHSRTDNNSCSPRKGVQSNMFESGLVDLIQRWKGRVLPHQDTPPVQSDAIRKEDRQWIPDLLLSYPVIKKDGEIPYLIRHGHPYNVPPLLLELQNNSRHVKLEHQIDSIQESDDTHMTLAK